MIKKATIGCVAVLVTTLGTFAAVTPLVRWSGDFKETTKGVFVLSANGNVVADDGSAITIADTATTGVTIDYPASVGYVTVAVRYSGLKVPSSESVLISARADSGDRSGMAIDPTSGQVCPIWLGKHYYDATSGLPMPCPLGASGRMAYCYHPVKNGNQTVDPATKGGYLFWACGEGCWAQYAKWGNLSGNDEGNITACAIGGPRSTGLACLKGLVIEEIVLFPGLMTADSLNSRFRVTRRLCHSLSSGIGPTRG